MNGKAVNVSDIPTNRRRRFTLLYFGLPPHGAEVRLTIRGTGPVTGTLVDYSNDLPKLPGVTVRPGRPNRARSVRLPRPHCRDPDRWSAVTNAGNPTEKGAALPASAAMNAQPPGRSTAFRRTAANSTQTFSPVDRRHGHEPRPRIGGGA